jgi:hypothetical protein
MGRSARRAGLRQGPVSSLLGQDDDRGAGHVEGGDRLADGLALERARALGHHRRMTADKLEKRLRRYKHKLKDHGAASHNGADIEAAYAVFAAR